RNRTSTFYVIGCRRGVYGADRPVGKRRETRIVRQPQRVPVDIVDLMGLDEGCMHDCAEFQHFICARNADRPIGRSSAKRNRNKGQIAWFHDIPQLVQGRLVRTLTARSAPTGEVHDGEIKSVSECLPMASLLPLSPVVSANPFGSLYSRTNRAHRCEAGAKPRHDCRAAIGMATSRSNTRFRTEPR